jgi:hypothetical protein
MTIQFYPLIQNCGGHDLLAKKNTMYLFRVREIGIGVYLDMIGSDNRTVYCCTFSV